MLDANAQLPLYKQLKEVIKTKINTGEYTENKRIPTEPEFIKNYGVSRITVRKAIEELVAEGYLVKKQGKGTFISGHKVLRKIEYVTGFSDSGKSSQLKTTSSLLKEEILSANQELAEKLEIPVGAKVLYTQRKRLGNGTPLLLENNYFDYARFAFLQEEDLTGSLYEILRKHDILPINPGETTLEIVTADDFMAKTMAVAIGTPFFYMQTVVKDQNMRPIHFGKQFYLGDAYTFSI
ncbi:GntR family transcriptional regulator [Enterococcus canintestini]|uniref:GntR family transcriptional regulator n=1 Tax=Enterococcus canintestini TaxID=317010 RepID=A0A267HTM3_9ENTE|nr:GntR family transcriptional regulator [Enterococcus canintestini]PAB01696.1 GntR family transcriptional regulator [Enterococcus canintestini]